MCGSMAFGPGRSKIKHIIGACLGASMAAFLITFYVELKLETEAMFRNK